MQEAKQMHVEYEPISAVVFHRHGEKFAAVAVVTVPDKDSVEHVLEDVFRLTNSVDCLWFENPGVVAFNPPTRSTSVGDAVYLPDLARVFFVKNHGFKEIRGETKCM